MLLTSVEEQQHSAFNWAALMDGCLRKSQPHAMIKDHALPALLVCSGARVSFSHAPIFTCYCIEMNCFLQTLRCSSRVQGPDGQIKLTQTDTVSPQTSC